jgi:hypothetical protein
MKEGYNREKTCRVSAAEGHYSAHIHSLNYHSTRILGHTVGEMRFEPSPGALPRV